MTDSCNYLLIQAQDVRHVSDHLDHALAELGAKVVAPETLGAVLSR